jgi:hypothetical protein
MDFEQALQLYENYLDGIEEKPVIKPRSYYLCECGKPYVMSNMYKLCSKCCTAEPLGAVVLPIGIRIKKSLYHRRLYFIERMNLLCGYKQCNSKEYSSVVRRCRKHKFSSIRQLRKIMKQIGVNKYYKYIYNIYYAIKKVRHVNITQQRIALLSQEFVIMEGFFKQNRDAHLRKNIFSYSVLMYMLLKRNKINGWSKILLPFDSKNLMTNVNTTCLKVVK